MAAVRDFVYSVPFSKEGAHTLKPPLKLQNDDVYSGEWNESDQFHGKGVLYSTDGSIFEGYWCDGEKDTRGRLVYPDGAIYEGDWQRDLPHGQGWYETLDGKRYDGGWKFGIYSGHGFEHWPDGTEF